MVVSSEIERLAERVRTSTRDGGLIETAQVKVIGLDQVREAAGARWPRMREQVREGSIRIIARHIGPDDAVIPCGDGFLVVFADGGSEQALRRCDEIRDALIAFYLGEEALRALRPAVQREPVSAASLTSIVSRGSSALAPQRTDLALGRFWPIWAARHKAVAAYLCSPTIDAGESTARIGYCSDFLEKANHDGRDLLDLDLCLLEQACAAADKPDAAPIGVSVHVTTLQCRRTRTIYLQHVAANGATIQRRMFITIAEIAPGTPLMSLTEWSNALKHTFARVALDLHPRDRALGALASTGVWAAGHHLPPLGSTSNSQWRATLNNLDSWCRTLRPQGIQPFFTGFSASGFLDLACFSDLAFASGEPLWPSTANPACVQRLSRAHETEVVEAP